MVQVFSVTQPLLPTETDVAKLDERTRELEAAANVGVDRVLVGYSSIWPHNHAYAPYMYGRSERLSLIVAHRPGVMDPAAAARYFSTLDVVAQGRLAINIVIGGNPKDLAREGDYTDKNDRYERANEYLDVMRQTWTEEASFDHHGKYYKEEHVKQLVRPVQGQVPIYMGGDSDEAVDFGARHADTYMLWGEPLAATEQRVRTVNKATEQYDRTVDFSLSLRVFLGETDEEAWAKAHAVEDMIVKSQEEGTGKGVFMKSSSTDASIGRQRQLEAAKLEMHDDCFWTRLVTLLGGFANSAALVGTPDRVMASLAAYRDIGIGAFLLTTGPFGVWDPELDDFVRRIKSEL